LTWPADVPPPGTESFSVPDKAAFDLICIATAYAFLHELNALPSVIGGPGSDYGSDRRPSVTTSLSQDHGEAKRGPGCSSAGYWRPVAALRGRPSGTSRPPLRDRWRKPPATEPEGRFKVGASRGTESLQTPRWRGLDSNF
jgi:hypothetical protein